MADEPRPPTPDEPRRPKADQPRPPKGPRDYRPDLRPMLLLIILLIVVVLSWLFLGPLILPPAR
ncbi:MAG: hypothetical protein ABI534_05090 [Chloroflexota bacterium]